MFDIGFLELVIVSVVGLLVLGPERLPGAIRTVMAYVNKIRRSFAGIRAEIERELQADEFRQDLHNQGIMEELRQAEKAIRSGLDTSDGKLGKDGYPLDDPYFDPEPVTQPPHAGEDDSKAADDTSPTEETAGGEPPKPAAEDAVSAEAPSADTAPEEDTRATKP